MPDFSGRDWNQRAFTIGIGGFVSSSSFDLSLLSEGHS